MSITSSPARNGRALLWMKTTCKFFAMTAITAKAIGIKLIGVKKPATKDGLA
jgi:hypothetical protein